MRVTKSKSYQQLKRDLLNRRLDRMARKRERDAIEAAILEAEDIEAVEVQDASEDKKEPRRDVPRVHAGGSQSKADDKEKGRSAKAPAKRNRARIQAFEGEGKPLRRKDR
ncbi:MAG: hypothetical protein ACXABY_21510 [Candidatus Thorarchaeota archaeon]